MNISRREFLATAGGGALTLLGGQQPANAALRGIDHLTILFKELEPAIQSYRELGFTVVPGGELPIGTHNAIVTYTFSNASKDFSSGPAT